MKQVARIAGTGFYAPSRVVTNEMVLDMLLEQSRCYLDDDELASLKVGAEKRLLKAGCERRRWCEPNEYCTDLARKASLVALERASVAGKEIDLIIYAGMSRAFVEPATAHVLRTELDASRANVIDLSDACAGFAKAMEIGNSLIRNGLYRTILIASGERTFDWADFRCKTADELMWKFGSLTVGDAAGAMVLRSTSDSLYTDATRHMELVTRHRSGTYSHCHIGLNHSLGERYRLFSHSRRLINGILDVARELVATQSEVDPNWTQQVYQHLFFHDVGRLMEKTVIPAFQHTMPGLPRTYKSYFSEYGNVASVSLPLNVWFAEEEHRIETGHAALFGYGAAGVQAGALSFVY